MNVPREPILKSEKWRRFFLHTLRPDRSLATHLCTTFGMAARNWNRTPKSWIRRWFVSVVIVSNAGTEINWIHREIQSTWNFWDSNPKFYIIRYSWHCYWAHSGRVSHKLCTAALCGGLSQVPNDSLSLSASLIIIIIFFKEINSCKITGHTRK